MNHVEWGNDSVANEAVYLEDFQSAPRISEYLSKNNIISVLFANCFSHSWTFFRIKKLSYFQPKWTNPGLFHLFLVSTNLNRIACATQRFSRTINTEQGVSKTKQFFLFFFYRIIFQMLWRPQSYTNHLLQNIQRSILSPKSDIYH